MGPISKSTDSSSSSSRSRLSAENSSPVCLRYFTICGARFASNSGSFGPVIVGSSLVRALINLGHCSSRWWEFCSSPQVQVIGCSFGYGSEGLTSACTLNRAAVECGPKLRSCFGTVDEGRRGKSSSFFEREVQSSMSFALLAA